MSNSLQSNSVWTAAHQASLSITNSQSLLKLTSISQWLHSTISSSAVPISSLLQFFPASESFPVNLCLKWPKYWSFSFSISPSNEYSGLISFRTDWFDLLEVQGSLKSLLQHHSSKASVLQCSAFFMVQLSHPCMTAGKTIALTIWTFVSRLFSIHRDIFERQKSWLLG